MSTRLTMASLQSAQCRAWVLANVCPDDPRLYSWASAFQERAWSFGKYWGSVQLAQFCLDSETCVTLPREIATIEMAKIGNQNISVQNMWGSFVRPHRELDTNFRGICGGGSCSCCGCEEWYMDAAGQVASFGVTTGTNQKIRAYATNLADAGKKIIFQGKDSNGIAVRTTIDGLVQYGEQVTLPAPPSFALTNTIWGPGAPVAVIKEPTSYRVLVYAVDADDTTLVNQIAIYSPSETHPTYTRFKVPRACCTSGDCDRTLKAIVSLQPIPLEDPNDWLLFQNRTAYQDGILSEKFREEGNQAMADSLFFGSAQPAKNGRGVLRYSDGMGALPLLRGETRRMTGDRTSVNIHTPVLDLSGFR